mgnify:CR=1 FL=1
MQTMKHKRLLSILLILCMVLALLPVVTTDHAHAGEWDQCTFCDDYRSDDYLCGNCGGCELY